MPRADAWTKVTGRERYAADYYARDFLWAGVKRSEIPHGRLIGIDTAAAKGVAGVTAVLTHGDVPGPNRHGIVHKNQPVLVDEKVCRVGDALALVLAENRSALERALDLIEVELSPLSPVFDPEEALTDGAPVIHEDAPGNLLAEIKMETGRGAGALDDCHTVVEGHFEWPRQEHAYLETEAGWAYLDPDGRVVVVASTQSPYRDVAETADALGLDRDRVRIVAPYLGGGFGGKDGASVQVFLALAALKADGRPVKMWWDREESFLASPKRLPARVDYRLGASADGSLKAMDCRILMDAGAHDHLCGEVLALAAEHAPGPYRLPDMYLYARAAYTNNPPGGAFRGFGVPQVTGAMEQMMDRLATKLGMDPLTLRLKNVIRRGDRNALGITMSSSVGLRDCLTRMAESNLWKNRESWKQEAGPFKRRGVGLAALWHGSGYGPVVPDFANAKIEMTPDGRFRVDAAVSDMGQGNAGACIQVAGDILNQETDVLDLVLPDTDQTLPSCSSAASRTSYTYLNALIGAARDLKIRILERAAVLFMAPSADRFILVPGLVRHVDSGRELPLDKIAATMSRTERTCTSYWRAPAAREKAPAQTKGAFGLPHLLFSFAVHLALVEVDELTGRVEVARYQAVTDGGRVLNPPVYHQQIQGGIVQGLGYALSEDYQVRRGRGLTPNLTTYILPTSLDAPEIDSTAVEIHEPTGPFGLKGIGEIPINGPLPAVSNGVADAIGVRICRAPLTPERILEAMNPYQGGKTASPDKRTDL